MFGEMLATGQTQGRGERRASTPASSPARRAAVAPDRQRARLRPARARQGQLRLRRGRSATRWSNARSTSAATASRRRSCSLRTRDRADLPPVRMDESAMTLVILNLVDNAVKYAADGGEVAVAAAARARAAVVLSVRDCGPGIAPDEQRRIFERFYRAESARARNVRGSGIGLALVKHIAEAHGGRVDGREHARARARRSRVLRCRSRRSSTPSAAKSGSAVVTGLTTSPATSPGRRRILIIEDEPDIVRGLRDALEFEGFEVAVAGQRARGRASCCASAAPDSCSWISCCPTRTASRCARRSGDAPARADHHADRALAGDRQDPRARRGRRRLRHQAVLRRRAGRAHQRHLPAPAARRRRRRTSASRSAARSSIRTNTS